MGLKVYKYFSTKQIWSLMMEAAEYRISKLIPEDIRVKKAFLKRIFSSNMQLEKLKNGLAIVYEINGKTNKFLLRDGSSDISVFTQIILDHEYKPIVELFQKLNYRIKRFIDIGANAGFSSIYLSAFYPDADFVCLEPHTENFKALETNLKNNISPGKCIFLQKAIWNRPVLLSADHSFRDGKEWSFSVKETNNSEGEIQGITMNMLMKDCAFDEVDFLKIDIEGAEEQLFSDEGQLESWLDKINILSIEIHDETNARFKIENTLQNLGFRLFNSREITIAVNNNLVPLLKNKE